jgi:NTP pyrophosphatase (non-canonical NTP hydrolase)
VTQSASSWLAGQAADIVNHLRDNGFDAAGAANRQVLCLAEEVGEFVGAYRRWTGQARRQGTAREVRWELADVVITAYVTAHELGIDLDRAIADKLGEIHARGWREPDSEPVGATADPAAGAAQNGERDADDQHHDTDRPEHGDLREQADE